MFLHLALEKLGVQFTHGNSHFAQPLEMPVCKTHRCPALAVLHGEPPLSCPGPQDSLYLWHAAVSGEEDDLCLIPRATAWPRLSSFRNQSPHLCICSWLKVSPLPSQQEVPLPLRPQQGAPRLPASLGSLMWCHISW